MKLLFDKLIKLIIRKMLSWYPDETILPDGYHKRSNPKRRPKTLTEAATLTEIYPEGKE